MASAEVRLDGLLFIGHLLSVRCWSELLNLLNQSA